MGGSWRVWLRIAFLLTIASAAYADCGSPKSIVSDGRITAETRPPLHWLAVEGAASYSLKVESRVPEGRLIASFDIVIPDPRFVPPTQLTDERAKVTVRVAARCEGEFSPTASGWFLIDTRLACPAPASVEIATTAGSRSGQWQPVSGATHYEVRVHVPGDGQVLYSRETREPHSILDAALPTGEVLSVRARCRDGFGAPAFCFYP